MPSPKERFVSIELFAFQASLHALIHPSMLAFSAKHLEHFHCIPRNLIERHFIPSEASARNHHFHGHQIGLVPQATFPTMRFESLQIVQSVDPSNPIFTVMLCDAWLLTIYGKKYIVHKCSTCLIEEARWNKQLTAVNPVDRLQFLCFFDTGDMEPQNILLLQGEPPHHRPTALGWIGPLRSLLKMVNFNQNSKHL